MKIFRLLRKYKLQSFTINRNLIKLRLLYPNCYFAKYLSINIVDWNRIMIGNNVQIHDYTILSLMDDKKNPNHIESFLRIGNNVFIGELNNIRVGGGTLLISDNVTIAEHVTIVCSNHGIELKKNIREQFWDTKKTGVKIEEDVWIGANAVILPGVTIGKHAIIGARAIVTKNIPENAIVCGNPAKIIKYRE